MATIERTKEMMEVMSHYAAGGEVEWRERSRRGTWQASDSPAWDWNCHEYRVAQQPKISREWINVYGNGCGGRFHESREDADSVQGGGRLACLCVEVTIGDKIELRVVEEHRDD